MPRRSNTASDPDAFSAPDTFPPVVSTYQMVTTVGIPRGHEAHFHPDTIEICFVRKGRLDWWIGDQTYEVHPGDVVVMPATVPHGSADSTLQPCEYCALHIDPKALSAETRRATQQPHFGGLHAGQTEAGDFVRRLYEEHQRPKAYSREVVRSLANLLVVQLARHGESAQDSPEKNYLVRRAIRALTEEEGGGKSIEEVARQLRVSTVWLTRVFRQELGQSPGEWARSRRLGEAKRLLSETQDSVIEIAIRLGYQSSQYFATAFRRETGLTPSQYRQRCTVVGPGAAAEIARSPVA